MAHLQRQLFVASAAALAALLVAAGSRDVAQSFARPESLDVDAAIQNETRLQEAVNCIVGDDDYGLCDAHTIGIKYEGRQILERGCSSNCTTDELGLYRFLAHVSHNKPEQWKQVLAEFDPNGTYKQQNSEQWREHGINV